MPDFLSEPQRWWIPAVLLVALVGTPIAVWWEKVRPTVPEHVARMRSWRRLSTAEQEAADTAALDEAQDVEVAAAEAAWAAERAAQAVVEQAARQNVLYHP